MRPDAVTADVRDTVLAMDGYRCVARRVDPDAGICRNKWNEPVITSGRYPPTSLTLDHVKDAPMMGKRAPSDPRHLVTLCWGHHLHSGWATSHRPELRAYLANRHGDTL